MKLDIRQTQLNSCSLFYALTASKQISRYQWQQELEPNTWVHLLELPSPFSFDEALLLCQHSETEWNVWIPEHGEAVLHVNQFFPIS